ncbi:MAG: alpha-amylase family glycosyl hydrolase [Anaerolineales bacterium]
MALSAHPTFPLSSPTLSRLSLTPEFNYSEPMNARRLNSLLQASQQALSPGEIAAAGLLGKIFLRVVDLYLSASPAIYQQLDGFLENRLGDKTASQGLRASLDYFPTLLTFHDPPRQHEYLFGDKGSAEKRHSFYSSLILIYTAECNPVFLARDGLFTIPGLRLSPAYRALRTSLESFFRSQVPFRASGKSLLDFLLEPLVNHPGSLSAQLEYIRLNWSDLLGAELYRELLTGLDRIREEHTKNAPLHPVPPQDPLGFSKASYLSDSDLVHFSADRDWMPRVILLAKNIYVWLDQLSRTYQRDIYRLDHIPENEFAKLADWGITGLWLIGLWERSSASQKIKQLCGNPDAVPSAYSLYDYTIADALGGEEGYQELLKLSSRHGIRLAADMVPNHMGIYSKWILQHPDWFISLDRSPYPDYSFSGPDLSPDPEISIFLEDHYYDKSDAAVVFQRQDFRTNDTRYIYHGNDGTFLPWNDTAQLNFLNPDVREAVIQTILQVARKFPIIRFDAAMTLTKKHYQRLWFPKPGSGGAIPTRSEFGMSAAEFNEAMPEEFWREVVDRIKKEMPDTLLLAEAFWMMEGYFVRTLGMHRVYNSAFMHMLRAEDNAKYRDLIIQTLEYDPQILKRYVNFMNNPDEDTAKSQFGSNGKYFGTCTLMATLPGLPMFGHGQIEGFSEKYGMEYRRAYYNEVPDQSFIDRHRREIFPLLHRRYLFAEVDNFVLYDFTDHEGSCNQDVFAYSNRSGTESALIVFHNKWGDTSGFVRISPDISGKTTSLLEGLGFSSDDGDFLLFRDLVSQLEYIRPLASFTNPGFEVSLGAFEYHVYLDFKAITDRDGSYKELSDQIGGRGVPSLEKERQALLLQPLREVLCKVVKQSFALVSADLSEIYGLERDVSEYPISLTDRLSGDLTPAFLAAVHKLDPEFNQTVLIEIKAAISNRLDSLIEFLTSGSTFPDYFLPHVAFLTIYLADIAESFSAGQSTALLDLLPTDSLTLIPAEIYPHHQLAVELRGAILVVSLISNPPDTMDEFLDFWFNTPALRDFLQINLHEDIYWFNKESFEILLNVSFTISTALQADKGLKALAVISKKLTQLHNRAQTALPVSDYQVDQFQKIVNTTQIVS